MYLATVCLSARTPSFAEVVDAVTGESALSVGEAPSGAACSGDRDCRQMVTHHHRHQAATAEAGLRAELAQ
jgi:hypothetical protein